MKKVSAVTVAAVLGVLGGTHAAEAATQSIAPGNTALLQVSENLPTSTVSPLQPQSNPLPSMKDIFADIRHDHPTQGYVTLEQSIRRIE